MVTNLALDDALVEEARRAGKHRTKEGSGDVRFARVRAAPGSVGDTRPRRNERSGTVIALALTSRAQRAGFPLTLELDSRGLPKRSWLKISQFRTLSVKRIGKRTGKTSAEEVEHAVSGLNEIIGT